MLRFSKEPREVVREDFPKIPGAFVSWQPYTFYSLVNLRDQVLHNVFSQDECDKLIAVSESMGYTEDAPVSLDRHIRQNENCVWIADSEMTRVAFERCLPYLPNGTTEKNVPVGLNGRRPTKHK